jgi:hypothetical protein
MAEYETALVVWAKKQIEVLGLVCTKSKTDEIRTVEFSRLFS